MPSRSRHAGHTVRPAGRCLRRGNRTVPRNRPLSPRPGRSGVGAGAGRAGRGGRGDHVRGPSGRVPGDGLCVCRGRSPRRPRQIDVPTLLLYSDADVSKRPPPSPALLGTLRSISLGPAEPGSARSGRPWRFWPLVTSFGPSGLHRRALLAPGLCRYRRTATCSKGGG